MLPHRTGQAPQTDSGGPDPTGTLTRLEQSWTGDHEPDPRLGGPTKVTMGTVDPMAAVQNGSTSTIGRALSEDLPGGAAFTFCDQCVAGDRESVSPQLHPPAEVDVVPQQKRLVESGHRFVGVSSHGQIGSEAGREKSELAGGRGNHRRLGQTVSDEKSKTPATNSAPLSALDVIGIMDCPFRVNITLGEMPAEIAEDFGAIEEVWGAAGCRRRP